MSVARDAGHGTKERGHQGYRINADIPENTNIVKGFGVGMP